MHRIFGSDCFSRFVRAGIASITLCFALAGCGSSSEPTGSCDLAAAQAIFTPKCATGGCHDASGSAAALDMASPGLAARLLNVTAPGGGSVFPSMCGGMNKVYLNKGSNPATGLFIEKLAANPSCGVEMPYTGAKLTTAQTDCIKSWATSVTTAP